MALHIEDQAVEELVEAIVQLTGETVTEVVRQALRSAGSGWPRFPAFRPPGGVCNFSWKRKSGPRSRLSSWVCH